VSYSPVFVRGGRAGRHEFMLTVRPN